MHVLTPGVATAYGLAALALLLLVQVVVATAAARRAGHVPGVPITDGPGSFAFRAQRAHQNTLENVVLFIVALAAARSLAVAPGIVDAAVIVFVGARVAHAIAYYAGVQRARTAAFAVGLAASLTLSIASVASALPASADTDVAERTH